MKRLIIICLILMLISVFSILTAQSRISVPSRVSKSSEEIKEEVKHDKTEKEVEKEAEEKEIILPVVRTVKNNSASRTTRQNPRPQTPKAIIKDYEQPDNERTANSRPPEQPSQRIIRNNDRTEQITRSQPVYRRSTRDHKVNEPNERDIPEIKDEDQHSSRQTIQRRRFTDTKPPQRDEQVTDKEVDTRNNRSEESKPLQQTRTRQSLSDEVKPIQREQNIVRTTDKERLVREEPVKPQIQEKERSNQVQQVKPSQPDYKPRETEIKNTPQPAYSQDSTSDQPQNLYALHHSNQPSDSGTSIEVLEDIRLHTEYDWQPPKHIWSGYDNHGGYYHNNYHWWNGYHNQHGWWGYYPHHYWNWNNIHINWTWSNSYINCHWYYPRPYYYHFGYYSYVNYYHWYPHHYWIVHPRFNFYYTWQDTARDFTGFVVANNWGMETTQHYDDDIDYEPYFNSDINAHTDECPRLGYGMFIKNSRGEYGFYHFDRYGSRIARRIMRNSHNPDRKVYVEVRGILDRSTHTIRVISMKKLSSRDNFAIIYRFPHWLYRRQLYWG